MAERRMFAKTIIDSDTFIDMPATARLLYYDLSMRADDDGFVNSPKKIVRMTGASTDDLNLLAIKKFIIPFESGVVVIRHWKIHNYIRKDTYNETVYKGEKSMLEIDENKTYNLLNTDRQPYVDEPSTQVRLGKDRIGKDSIGESEDKKDNSSAPVSDSSISKFGKFQNVMLTDQQIEDLNDNYSGWENTVESLSAYMASSGKKYRNHYATVIKWYKQDNPDSGNGQFKLSAEYESL